MNHFGQQPLSPTAFLERARHSCGDRVAVRGTGPPVTYDDFAARCDRLAGALRAGGLRRGAIVSVLSPNTAPLLEAHFGIPQGGCVINALNTRLSVDELAYIVDHAEAELLIADVAHGDAATEIAQRVPRLRVIISGHAGSPYDEWRDSADPYHHRLADENSLLALNYTSGTTGRPKGVMYSHRGAYLQALAMTAQSGLHPDSVFLWTLPMFHCNGWCFPWAVTALGGTHVELVRVDPERIWQAVRTEGVTHFNAAPTVLTALAWAPEAEAGPAPQPITVGTGGSPPSPALLERLETLNISVAHLYGLTETYGPAVVCDWHHEWDQLPGPERARLKARQGVANLVSGGIRVVDRNGIDVPHDAKTIGEVLLTGNNVMLGYHKDPAATAAASLDGWFRTGDLGVMHPDGYIELRDRAKDIIISGGENISSIEVEQAINSHPAVLESAVVAARHTRWGEVPVAYVTLKPDETLTETELVEHVKARIARFKAPNRVVFGDLPKTATGKIQKFVLRERAAEPPT